MAHDGGREDSVSNCFCAICQSYYTYLYIFRGFEKDPKTSKFEMLAKVPLDIIKGKYSINGKLLVLPLQGTGDLEIKHSELH